MENNSYEIEKDKILNCWIVWEVHNNYKVDVYRNKLKKKCENFVEGKEKA